MGPLLLRTRDVLKLVPVGRSTLWRMVKNSEFPRPIRIGPRAVGWRVYDIEKWIESRPEA